jgi:hypothetical protein
VPVEPAPGSDDPEDERAPEPIDPPANEPPPADEALPPDVLPDAEPPPQEDEEEAENDEPEPEEGEEGEEKPRSAAAPAEAGDASESTNTSPRMCSTYWSGTPGWLTGWVNTTCTPVAVTVISPELELSRPKPMLSWSLVVVVVPEGLPGVDVVPVPVAGAAHEPVVVLGRPVPPQELVMPLPLDWSFEVVVVAVGAVVVVLSVPVLAPL